MLGPQARLQCGVQHARHPVARVAAQRRLQRHPGQRPVPAGIGAEREQHQRLNPPRLGHGARQNRPQRLDVTGIFSNGKGIEHVAHLTVGQRAAQLRQLNVGQRLPAGDTCGGGHRVFHIPAAAARGIRTMCDLARCRLLSDHGGQFGAARRVVDRDESLQVGPP